MISLLFSSLSILLFSSTFCKQSTCSKIRLFSKGVSVLANREVMQALTTLAHFNNMTNGSLFGTAFGQVPVPV
jgi:hypothetical protein